MRIGGDVVLEPERAFEVEIVGRLVEQQEVGLGEQHGGERDPHAPAAGEGRARPLLRCLVEAEAGEDGGGARLGGMGVDVGEARVDLGDAVAGRGRSPPRPSARRVRGRRRARSRSGFPARPAPPARPRRSRLLRGTLIEPDSGSRSPHDQAEQRRLAGAVAADEAGLGAGRQRDRGVVDEHPVADPVGEVVDVEHGSAVLPCSRSAGKAGRGQLAAPSVNTAGMQ